MKVLKVWCVCLTDRCMDWAMFANYLHPRSIYTYLLLQISPDPICLFSVRVSFIQWSYFEGEPIQTSLEIQLYPVCSVHLREGDNYNIIHSSAVCTVGRGWGISWTSCPLLTNICINMVHTWPQYWQLNIFTVSNKMLTILDWLARRIR